MSHVQVSTINDEKRTVVCWQRDERPFGSALSLMSHPGGGVTMTVTTGDGNNLTHLPPEALREIVKAFLHADAEASRAVGGAAVEHLLSTPEGDELADALDKRNAA